MGVLRTFSAQAEPEILDAFEQIAASEGRKFQVLLDEAMREYLTRRREHDPNRATLEAFRQSLEERDELYRLLAK
jgi:hypothetical protein